MSKKQANQALTRSPQGRFVPGVSGNPSGLPKSPRADAAPTTSVKRRDGWHNVLTGAGVFGRDKRMAAGFSYDALSFDQLAILWRGDDLAARAVETLPKEALRQGYDLIVPEDDPDDGQEGVDRVSEVTDKLDTLGADVSLEIALGYERGYGGGAILLGVNDGQADLTKPLNLNAVRSIDWLTPLEPREILPVYGYADPRAPKYGQPEIYRLTSRAVLPSRTGTSAETTMDIHESRMLIFPGIRVSRYQITSTYGGWGDSTLNRMWRVLRDFNTAWSSAGVLVSDFAQAVYKMSNLWETLSSDNADAFGERLLAMDLGRSTVNMTVIDKDDEYIRQQTPISGLPDLLDRFSTRLAAAADMPLTLLFGTSPAGLNATGESDIRFFYDRVASYQARRVMPQLRQLIQIVMRTTGNKTEPKKWSVRFRPLWQESAKDRAQAMLIQSQADAANITSGVYSAEEAASSHWSAGEYNPEITLDFNSRDKQIAAASAPVSQDDEDALDPGGDDGDGGDGGSPDGGGGEDGGGSPDGEDEGEDEKPRPVVSTGDSANERRDYYANAAARRKKQKDAKKKKRREADDYTPPPGPGSLKQKPPSPAPDPRPAEPDPNTRPNPIVNFGDAVDDDNGEVTARKTPRPAGRKAAPRPALGLHSDEWSEAAREAAAETRRKNAEKKPAPKPPGEKKPAPKPPGEKKPAPKPPGEKKPAPKPPGEKKPVPKPPGEKKPGKRTLIGQPEPESKTTTKSAPKAKASGGHGNKPTEPHAPGHGQSEKETKAPGNKPEGKRLPKKAPGHEKPSEGKAPSGKHGGEHVPGKGEKPGRGEHGGKSLVRELANVTTEFATGSSPEEILKGKKHDAAPDFEDAKHPRDQGGKFSSSPNEKGTGSVEEKGHPRHVMPKTSEKVPGAIEEKGHARQAMPKASEKPAAAVEERGHERTVMPKTSEKPAAAVEERGHERTVMAKTPEKPTGIAPETKAPKAETPKATPTPTPTPAPHASATLSEHAESQRQAAHEFLAQHQAGLETSVAKLREIAAPGTQVDGRVKTVESALGKLDRKPEHYQKPSDLWDGTGVRMTSKTMDEVKKNVDAVKASFHVVQEENYIEHPNGGYRSVHLAIRDHDGLMKEVQIRTVNQDKWANWSHDIYKPQTAAQHEALVHHRDEIHTYGKQMSNHYHAIDSGRSSSPVPCPPVLHSTFGCLD